MISTKLVKMIEDHADQLVQELVKDIFTNPKTYSYRQFSEEELVKRTHNVYKNLGS